MRFGARANGTRVSIWHPIAAGSLQLVLTNDALAREHVQVGTACSAAARFHANDDDGEGTRVTTSIIVIRGGTAPGAELHLDLQDVSHVDRDLVEIELPDTEIVYALQQGW